MATEDDDRQPEPCIGNDPTCPCRDGGPCHYRAYGDSAAWPIPGGGEQS